MLYKASLNPLFLTFRLQANMREKAGVTFKLIFKC